METYSAGLVSQSFWFIEFKKVIRLFGEGKSSDEIKELCIAENLFGAANPYRAKRMTGYLIKRAKALDAQEIGRLMHIDLETQKLLDLIAILRLDRLFFEFLFEVYREKIILGIPVLEDRDASIFFKNKEIQSQTIEEWKESTKSHLRQCFFNYMVDANLLTMDGKIRKITPPMLDITLERHLEEKGESAIIKALTGVNR